MKSIHKVCKFCRKSFKVFYCHRNRYIYCSIKCRCKDAIGKPRLHKGKYSYYVCMNEEGKEVKYHRYILEKYLGRQLNPSEHVHHIDHNTLNNDISNLQIMSQAEHKKLHKTVISTFKCQWCDITFHRNTKRFRKFCSLSCASRYGNSLRKT